MNKLNEQTESLKAAILSPAYADKEGKTDLDKRAEKNATLTAKSSKKIEDEKVVMELIDSIHEFKSQDISLLFSFVKRSGLNGNEICKKALYNLESHIEKYNVYQRAEILKFALNESPDDVNPRLIETSLVQLKITDPWLYTDFLAKRAARQTLKYIEYLIQDKKYNSSSFVTVLMTLLNFHKKNHRLLTALRDTIRPLIENLGDNDALEMIDFKLEEIRHEEWAMKGTPIIRNNIIPADNNSFSINTFKFTCRVKESRTRIRNKIPKYERV